MSLQLFQRVSNAFTAGSALLHEREPLIRAVQHAPTFDDLPPAARQLLLELEARGRQDLRPGSTGRGTDGRDERGQNP